LPGECGSHLAACPGTRCSSVAQAQPPRVQAPLLAKGASAVAVDVRRRLASQDHPLDDHAREVERLLDPLSEAELEAEYERLRLSLEEGSEIAPLPEG
jgi:hypothetical protein